MMKKLVTIIVRTKNEENWIKLCIDSIRKQSYSNYEIIVVDTGSIDHTLDIVALYSDCRVIKYHGDYYPGKVLNFGCTYANGEILVFLSAHCYAVNENWLEALVAPLDEPSIAGVYGKQEPTDNTSPLDKRDLILTFGLERKIQRKEPFFHNANSSIKKELWEQLHFDETVLHIEDRVWAANMQNMGYAVLYEPNARAYHYHGIHQTGCRLRCEGVNKIVDNLDKYIVSTPIKKINYVEKEVIAVIPFSTKINSKLSHNNTVKLYEQLVADIQKVNHINKIILLSDSEALYDYTRKHHPQIVVPYLRKDDSQFTLLKILKTLIEKERIPDSMGLLISEVVYWTTNRNYYFEKLCSVFKSENCSGVIWLRKSPNAIFKNYLQTFYRFDQSIVEYRNTRDFCYESHAGLGKIVLARNVKDGYFINDNTVVLKDSKMTPVIKLYNDADVNAIQDCYNYLICDRSIREND